jgi:hypothetical protein
VQLNNTALLSKEKADTGGVDVAKFSDDLENALDFIISDLLELESGEGLCAITLPKIFFTASL